MTKNNRALVVAAHPDDEVLGCGGTIALMARQEREVHVLLLADGEDGRADHAGQVPGQSIDARKRAAQAAGEILGCASVETLELPDNRLDSVDLLDIVKLIEVRIKAIEPTTLLTHHAGDVNVDHRLVHQAVLAATRPQPGHCLKELLFFEVPSSTEWCPPGSGQVFAPNWFVNISSVIAQKQEALQAYKDELREFPHPRSVEGIAALARWRGVSVGVEAAEAFMLGRKTI